MFARRGFARWAIACATAALFGPSLFLPRAHAAGSRRTLVENLRFGPGLANHPVGVVPSRNVRIPGDWPLESDGTIGCRTCHRELPSFADGSSPFLREIGGKNIDRRRFCGNCHTRDNAHEAAAIHWLGVGAAHILPAVEHDVSAADGLDAESKRCLSCHDGINASDAINSTRTSLAGGSFSDVRTNHPVGVQYPVGRRVPHQSAYRHPSSLPPDVRLPGGKVSCVSCHNLYARGRRFLSVTTKGSALCFTCHDLD